MNNPQNLRIRLPDTLKKRWDAMLDRKRITQQDAILSLVELVLEQKDDVVQSMLLGQTKPRRDLLEALLGGLTVPRVRTHVLDPDGTMREGQSSKS